MPEITRPRPFDGSFADVVGARKADFVATTAHGTLIAQHGAALIDPATVNLDVFPGWPPGLSSTAPVIETYVAGGGSTTALSGNEPYVSRWHPLVVWMDTAVRTALRAHGLALEGDAYVTASLTATDLLEGVAHMDDDTFGPDDSVGVVAIIGELAGPRIATRSISTTPLRPMSQIVFNNDQLVAFAADEFDHCTCEPDELVVFPQFGQLHAGPAAAHVAGLSPARQLLVFRGAIRQPATPRSAN